MTEVTEAAAEAWRRVLLAKGLVENSARKHIAVAKLFFAAAVSDRLTTSNPFGGLKAAIMPNIARFHFVGADDARLVLESCPDQEWRVIFALARWGGLRTPSETLAVEWRHIDWHNGRVTVPSPKTAHHAGGESRVIPLFPELREELSDLFDIAEAGPSYVITRYRRTNQNLRTQLTRIVTQAGLPMWPKPFQNLRSTRETELAETYPIHCVTAWLGNTEAVAARHYLQVTSDHFQRAASMGGVSLPERARNAARPVQEGGCTASQPKSSEAEKQVILRTLATSSDSVQAYSIAEAGLEPARGLPPTGF